MADPDFLPILGFGIAGYRSFGKAEQRFGPCSRINLLVGQNNSGKSNVLRFLQDRYRFFGKSAGPFPKLEDIERHISPMHIGSHFSVVVPVKDEVKNRWDARISPPISHRILQELGPCGLGYCLEFDLQAGSDKLSASDRMVQCITAVCGTGRQLASTTQGLFNSATTGIGISADPQNAQRFIDELWSGLQIPKCFTIPAIRKPGAAEFNAATLGGEDLVHRLARLQNPSYGEQELRKDFERIEGFLQLVTDRPDAKLEIPYDRTTVVVHMDGRSLPLSALGTGIHEVVILAAVATVLHRCVICVEEPEVHLHPL